MSGWVSANCSVGVGKVLDWGGGGVLTDVNTPTTGALTSIVVYK